jgi:hypothetical protein
MAISHKAYAVDWLVFEKIRPRLERALIEGDPSGLFVLIDEDISSFRDPYEGEPLSSDWRSNLECGDVHEVGDFVLTTCYDPRADFGLGAEWMRIDGLLPISHRSMLLGSPLGQLGRLFDPGKLGSYFQDPEQLRHSLGVIQSHSEVIPRSYLEWQAAVVAKGEGLYVTF